VTASQAGESPQARRDASPVQKNKQKGPALTLGAFLSAGFSQRHPGINARLVSGFSEEMFLRLQRDDLLLAALSACQPGCSGDGAAVCRHLQRAVMKHFQLPDETSTFCSCHVIFSCLDV